MFSKSLRFLATLSVVSISGCTGHNGDSTRNETAALRREYQVHGTPGERTAVVPSCGQIAEPRGVVTLRDAVAFALVNNPELRAFSLEVRAAEARKLQAGLLPNPQIEFEVEEFGVTDERSNFDSSETAIQLG